MITLGDVVLTDPMSAKFLILKLRRGDKLSPDLIKELCRNLLNYSIEAITPAKLLGIMEELIQYLDVQQLLLLAQDLIFSQAWMVDIKKGYKLITGVALAIVKLPNLDPSVWRTFVQNAKTIETIYTRLSVKDAVLAYQAYVIALVEYPQRSFPALFQALNDEQLSSSGIVEAIINKAKDFEQFIHSMDQLNQNNFNQLYYDVLYNLILNRAATSATIEQVCHMIWMHAHRRDEYRTMYRNLYHKLPAPVLKVLYSQNLTRLSKEERVAILSAQQCPLSLFHCEIETSTDQRIISYCWRRITEPDFYGVCWSYI